MATMPEYLECLRDSVLEIIGSECSSGSYNAVSKAFDDAEAHLSQPAQASGGVVDDIAMHWRPLLQWAIGTIETMNDGPLEPYDWDEDAGLFYQAKELAFAASTTKGGGEG